MKKSLQGLSEHGRATHIEGQKYAKAHRDSFEALRKTARETSDHMQNVMNPALVGLGLSAVTVGGSIAALTKSIKELGEFGREMSFLTRETGLSTNELNTWVEAGARAGLSFGQITQDLKAANQEIAQFRQHRGPLMEFFAVNAANPVIAKLRADILASKDEAEAVEDIYKSLDKLPDATRHLLEEATHLNEFHRISEEARKKAGEQTYQFTDADKKALHEQQEAFDDTAAAYKKLRTELSLSLSPAFKQQAIEWRLLMQGEFAQWFAHVKADAEVLGEEMKGIFGGVGSSLGDGLKVAEDDIDGWIKSLKGELAELNEWWEGHGDKAKPNAGPKILGPGDPGYNEAPTAEKMSYRGRIPDLPGGGPQKAAYRTGEETPGAEIRAEAVMYRATMRGTAEGSRIGVLAAFHELEDEKRRGGVIPAAYHPGGTAEEGGLGGGYGGLGGGVGGGLGGGGGQYSHGSPGSEPSASAASNKGPHGHPGQRAILEGHVKEAAATIKAAKAARGGGSPGAVPGPPGDAPSGEGQFNFMHGQFGAHGDMAHIHQYKTASGRRIMLNDESAKHMVPFLNEMEKMGMPFTRKSGAYDSFNDRPIRGGSTWSQHAYGNAVDLEATGFNPTKEMGEWQKSHADEMREAMNRWGIKWGGDMRRRDTPHFEWGGTEGTHAPVMSAGGNAKPAELATKPEGTTKPDLTNNPGDIHYPGTALDYQKLYGGTKSDQGDQGAPLYQFPSMKAGLDAMEGLAKYKYNNEGRKTANQIIAEKGGWTPGALGKDAAKHIARDMGIGPDDDLGLGDAKKMLAFKRALAKQEGSKEGVEALKDMKATAEAVKAAAADHPLPHARLGDSRGTRHSTSICAGFPRAHIRKPK